MRDVMTPEQVAEHLQVSTDTVYRLIKNGDLVASRVGGAHRIRREDVERFLIAQSTEREIIEELFRRVDESRRRIAAMYPDLTEEDVLAELEAIDEERRQARANAVPLATN